jgi:hypothetical protein
MDIGNYVNLFTISFEKGRFTVAEAPRSRYPSLKDLRTSLKYCVVYAVENTVYGFGSDLAELVKLSFEVTERAIEDTPRLTVAIIKDGVSSHLKKLGYELEYGFANRVFELAKPLPTRVEEVRLFRGFEFRPIYLMDRVAGKLFFSLIIDLRHKLELNGNPASYMQVFQFVSSKHGEDIARQTIRDIKVRTGDLSPGGGRNPEASRFRLTAILDFVKELRQVALFDNSIIHISSEPIRVIGGEY